MAHFRRNTIYCKLKICLVHIAWMGGRGKSTSSCLKYLQSQIGCWVGGSKLIETCLLNMQFFHFEGIPYWCHVNDATCTSFKLCTLFSKVSILLPTTVVPHPGGKQRARAHHFQPRLPGGGQGQNMHCPQR